MKKRDLKTGDTVEVRNHGTGKIYSLGNKTCAIDYGNKLKVIAGHTYNEIIRIIKRS